MSNALTYTELPVARTYRFTTFRRVALLLYLGLTLAFVVEFLLMPRALHAPLYWLCGTTTPSATWRSTSKCCIEIFPAATYITIRRDVESPVAVDYRFLGCSYHYAENGDYFRDYAMPYVEKTFEYNTQIIVHHWVTFTLLSLLGIPFFLRRRKRLH